MEADPDRELVERCRQGQPEALTELVERYGTAIYVPIARGVPDAIRAESLAHEVFRRIQQGLPYFRGEAPLTTWIDRTVTDVCPEAIWNSAPGSPEPQLPEQFRVRTLAQLSRDRWRREQVLDVVFNASISLVGVAIIIGGWYVLSASGLSRVSRGTLSVVSAQVTSLARSAAPSLPGYLAAAALIGAVLLVWWWAER
jgi:hypothetical protein